MLYLLSTSCVLTLASSLLFPGYSTAAQFLPTRGSSLSATRTMRTSRCSSPSRRPCGALFQLRRAFIVFVLRFRCIRHFVINVINNIRISIYYVLFVICAVIYCSFCCIYVWLDPGTYMIARFMFFYKPGVTINIRTPLSLPFGLPQHLFRRASSFPMQSSWSVVSSRLDWLN